jgi:glyoxylase-like metal-dependent hydrolase (beta-lactamase superfamily II)
LHERQSDMIRWLFLFTAFFVNSGLAQSKPLEVEVLRTSAGSLYANIALIKGDTKAVLVDAPFTRADAHRVVGMILDSGKELETIFVGHDHPDHFFAIEVITEAFPKAKVVAHPIVSADIWRSLPFKVKRWYPVLGMNAPRTPTAPLPLEGDTIWLEGQALKVIGPMQGDHVHATALWVPSIKALFPGDLVYNEMFLWFGEHDPTAIAAWGKALDDLAALKPAVVVAGHSKPGQPNDISGITYSQRYIAAWPKLVAASKDAKDLSARTMKAFPNSVDILGDFLLGNSSRVAKGEQPAWVE